ncbi:hypothetical protein DMA12_16245 [Amycolatopsis balhimycina DSM 5908]|uniref:Uncharacterized protein n=1 Tax=Amycolatopsis balhimycina DSM 5908 TaxID=1081091 RepID=A0A428WMU9_AMYBA|nr:hypothetical protein [Amycolatopsis balhimycina]RSM44383.1 hypothetical protein DMA12_16245 [Amycolatopsis balhimycina DSM 5908]
MGPELKLEVGADIPLAHAIAREIIHSGPANETFIERATEGFADFGGFPLRIAEFFRDESRGQCVQNR